MLFERGRRRKNGLDAPHSREQIGTFVLYFLTTFINYSIIISSCRDISFNCIISLSIIFTAVVLINWYLVSTTDPEVKGDENHQNHISQACWKVQRCNSFCIDCNKTIYRIDHHCSFLNTCIGEKNYLNFFVLITFCMLQMFYHLFITISFAMNGIYFMRIIIVFEENVWLRYLIVAVQGLISLLFAFYVFCLWVLHVYLNCWKRKGTYDWILSGREKRLYHLQEDGEKSTSLTESRIEHLRRQREREKYALQMEEAKKKREKAGSNLEFNDGFINTLAVEGEDIQTSFEKQDSLPHLILPDSTAASESNDTKKSKPTDHFLGTFAIRGKGASIYPDLIVEDPILHDKKNKEESVTIARRHIETTAKSFVNDADENNHTSLQQQFPGDVSTRTVDMMTGEGKAEL